MNNTLGGKVVIVTGASRGIGAAITRTFLEEGASVVLFGRDVQLLHEVAGTTNKLAGCAHVVVGDVNNSQDRQRLVTETLEKYKKIDILIPNAGVVEFASLEHCTEELLARHFETNFFSAVWLTQAVVPHLRSGSAIVYMSTSITNGGFPMLSAYAASKGALKCFMQCMAVELAGKGIAVNAVAPGPTQTEMWSRALPPQALEHVGAQILPRLLTGEFGSPDHIARTVAWIATTPTLRGREIVVDSGYTIS